MSFTVAVCDDDKEQISYICKILQKWAKERDLDVKTDTYPGAEQFLFAYADHPCDMLLLDIEMGALSGMELAKRLRGEQDALPIVFLTGYPEYISEGYDVEALHYLLKPIDARKLCGVLDKYISRGNLKTEEILVKTKDCVTHVCAERILYIEAYGRRSQIVLHDGSKLDCAQSIGQFAHLSGFLCCHRSYLVNLRYIRSIAKTAVILDTGAEIPLSRRLYREVNRQFIMYYKGEEAAWNDGD